MQEIQFVAFLVASMDMAVEQNESQHGVGSLNEIQTGSCRAYRLRFHPQRLARRFEKRVGALFLSHASARISTTAGTVLRPRTLLWTYESKKKIHRIKREMKQMHRKVEDFIQY